MNLAKKGGSEEIYEGSRLTFSEKNMGGPGGEAPRKILTFFGSFFKGFLVMGSGSNQLCEIFAKRRSPLATTPNATSLQTIGRTISADAFISLFSRKLTTRPNQYTSAFTRLEIIIIT